MYFIDDVFFSVVWNNAIRLCRAYEPRLSRTSCSQVDELRDVWRRLVLMSDRVTSELLREKRVIFEQELDKQVKVSESQSCDNIRINVTTYDTTFISVHQTNHIRKLTDRWKKLQNACLELLWICCNQISKKSAWRFAWYSCVWQSYAPIFIVFSRIAN